MDIKNEMSSVRGSVDDVEETINIQGRSPIYA